MFNSNQIRMGITTAGALGVMTIAVPFVAGWESIRQYAYYDPVQIPTICWGETENVKMGDYKTREECDALLITRLDSFYQEVDKLVLQPQPETRMAALTSFAYNTGITNFSKSTLLKLLNRGEIEKACKELPKWVYAKGIKLNGLVRRRAEEMKLCLIGLEAPNVVAD